MTSGGSNFNDFPENKLIYQISCSISFVLIFGERRFPAFPPDYITDFTSDEKGTVSTTQSSSDTVFSTVLCTFSEMSLGLPARLN